MSKIQIREHSSGENGLKRVSLSLSVFSLCLSVSLESGVPAVALSRAFVRVDTMIRTCVCVCGFVIPNASLGPPDHTARFNTYRCLCDLATVIDSFPLWLFQLCTRVFLLFAGIALRGGLGRFGPLSRADPARRRRGPARFRRLHSGRVRE